MTPEQQLAVERGEAGKPRISISELAAKRTRCQEAKAKGQPCEEFKVLTWAYGVTTVPHRIGTYLPRTLGSLAAAGFPRPRIFADGCSDASMYGRFGCEVTARSPQVRCFGNWYLSAAELYVRNPTVDRYAIFQDDLIACAGLRQYLESMVPFPSNAYLNLFTLGANQQLAPKTDGWFPSNQLGLGAVALVFDTIGMRTLLSHQNTLMKPVPVATPLDPTGERSFKSVDGMIVTSMQMAGYREMVHSPSLVQHTGVQSSMNDHKIVLLAPRFEEAWCEQLRARRRS